MLPAISAPEATSIEFVRSSPSTRAVWATVSWNDLTLPFNSPSITIILASTSPSNLLPSSKTTSLALTLPV